MMSMAFEFGFPDFFILFLIFVFIYFYQLNDELDEQKEKNIMTK